MGGRHAPWVAGLGDWEAEGPWQLKELPGEDGGLCGLPEAPRCSSIPAGGCGQVHGSCQRGAEEPGGKAGRALEEMLVSEEGCWGEGTVREPPTLRGWFSGHCCGSLTAPTGALPPYPPGGRCGAVRGIITLITSSSSPFVSSGSSSCRSHEIARRISGPMSCSVLSPA